jgi:hypothetical protein
LDVDTGTRLYAPITAFDPTPFHEREMEEEAETASSSFQPGFNVPKTPVKKSNKGTNCQKNSQDDSYGSNVAMQLIPHKKNKQITLHQDSVLD